MSREPVRFLQGIALPLISLGAAMAFLSGCEGVTELAALETRVTRLEQQIVALELAQADVTEKWSQFDEDFRTRLGVAIQIGDTRQAWEIIEEEAGVDFNVARACWRDHVTIGEPLPSCWQLLIAAGSEPRAAKP